MQADDVCLHWSFLQFHVLNLVFHRICKRFSNSLAASSQRYRIYPNTQDTLDFFRLCVCVCWALLNVGLKCHKNAKAYKCNARTTHTLIHSLAHSFIPALTHTPHANHLHTWAANGLFSHFSKGSVALKGNLLCFFALFAERISFFCSKTQHTMLFMTMGHIVCGKGIFFQCLGQLIYTHTYIHTHTHAHTNSDTLRVRRTFLIIIQKRHIGAHLNWFLFGPVPVRLCVCVLWVSVCVCVLHTRANNNNDNNNSATTENEEEIRGAYVLARRGQSHKESR